MKSTIIRLLAETHVHPGVGQSMGALDLPVARERTTDFPFIPGSGVKGAFRVWASEMAKMPDKDVETLFGSAADEAHGQQETGNEDGTAGESGDKDEEKGAGTALFSDARLLLLPVRCLSDAFKWVTCPMLLNRFARDCKRAGLGEKTALNNVSVSDGHYLGKDTRDKPLRLEEREFSFADDIGDTIINALKDMADEAHLKQRLVILSDKDFTWFARYALPIMARNKLDENKRVDGGALWNEETLAPDTVMYVLLGERKDGAVKKLAEKIGETPYIQMGGNETIGQGWFEMKVLGEASNG